MTSDRKFSMEQQVKTGQARSLAEAAYDAIRNDVLSGALKPNSKLRVEMLRQRYSYGSGALRDALIRLAGESLITSEEQRGFRVAPISLEDLEDLTQARIFVENKILSESIRVGDDAWEAVVVAAYYRLSKIEMKNADNDVQWSNEMEERNRAFHFAIVSACPSRWLNQLYGFLFQQSERYRRISGIEYHMPKYTHVEHKAIFDAVISRNTKAACEAACLHIESTCKIIASIF